MTQLSKVALNADIINNIYTNKQRLIKGNTVKQRLLNLKESTLNTVDDLNAPYGYLGLDAAGRVNISFINSPTPTGKFLRDNGTWAAISPLPSQTGQTGKALFTDGNTASWTAITAELINTTLGYIPVNQSTQAGYILIGNGSNIATPAAFTLNATAGSFSLSTSGELTMPNAGSGSRGLLTASDWSNFNNKQNALGFTPVSNSLAAGNIFVGNGSNTAAGVSFSLSASAGSFSLSSLGVLTMPNATGALRGLLTSADWSTFNNKQNAIGYTPLNKAGDTMSGALTLAADAVNSMEAVTYQQLQAWQVGLWDDRGSYNASGNVYPSSGGSGSGGAILKGDIWTVSAPGVLGGVSVSAGSTLRALVNSPGSLYFNWAIGQGNLGYTPLSNSLTSGNIFVGNGSNTAASVSLSLNASAGTFGLSNTGVLTLPNADSGNRGLLTAADWNSFNNKQNALGFTPLSGTLSSGRIFIGDGSNKATPAGLSLNEAGGTFSLSNTGVLTMPNASADTRGLLSAEYFSAFASKQNALGYTPLSNSLGAGRIFIGNGSNVAAAVTLSLGSSGGSFSISSDGLMTMPNASTSARGLLTASDWNSFNGKVSKTGSNSSGQITFWADGNTISSNSDVGYYGNMFSVNGQIVSAKNMYSQAAANMSVAGYWNINCSESNSFSFKLDSDTLFNLESMTDGMTIVIAIHQNEAYPFNIDFSSASGAGLLWKDGTPPVMTPTPNKVDVFTFWMIENVIYGFYAQNF